MVGVGSVIQVNELVPEWAGCLMIVNEVKDWGVTAGLKVPMQGVAYLRLTHSQYEFIGDAVFMEVRDE